MTESTPIPIVTRSSGFLLSVEIRDYVYLVPYVDGAGILFLKTIIPSRKAAPRLHRRWQMNEKLDAEEQRLLEEFDKGEWVSDLTPDEREQARLG